MPSAKLTGPYELYCPGTPVGNIALNDAVTSATLSPAAPTAGQSFSVTGYQTVVNLPGLTGECGGGPLARSTADGHGHHPDRLASGATPATTPEGPTPSACPSRARCRAGGVSLSLPSTPATVTGFTASSANITIQEDSSASLSLIVSGAPLALTCTAYPNDSVALGHHHRRRRRAAPIAPVIAVAGTGSSTTTTPPTAHHQAPSTGSGGGGAVAAAPGRASAPTWPSPVSVPAVGILGVIGGVLILLGFALLVLVDAPRRAFASWRDRHRFRAPDGASDVARTGWLISTRWVGGSRATRASRTPRSTGHRRPRSPHQVAEPTQSAATQPEAAGRGTPSSRSRGMGDRFARVPEVSREMAQTTARHAVRTAQWLLGR